MKKTRWLFILEIRLSISVRNLSKLLQLCTIIIIIP